METLGDRIKKARNLKGMTQEELGKIIGVKKASVSQWESGLTKQMIGENLIKTAIALRVTPDWLVHGKGEMSLMPVEESPKIQSNATLIGPFDTWDSNTPLRDDEVALNLFREVKMAAGKGFSEVIENHGATLRFAKSTLRTHSVDEADAACAFAEGNSMEPVIRDGSAIGIDKSKTEIRDGKIYAIDHDGHLRIKIVYRMPGGGIRLKSYNSDEYPDEIYKADDAEKIRILGFVFWWSVMNKW